MTYILTHSTSLIIYKTLFWRLKNQSCDLNELLLDAGINCYFSLVNLVCVINFIIMVPPPQADLASSNRSHLASSLWERPPTQTLVRTQDWGDGQPHLPAVTDSRSGCGKGPAR